MGTLHYGASRTKIRIDDRTLAHLQAVITAKLRRNEGLLVYWERRVEHGCHRGAFWVHPNCDLTYDYDGGREPALDPAELDRMFAEASGRRGLRIVVDDSDAHTLPRTHSPLEAAPVARASRASRATEAHLVSTT